MTKFWRRLALTAVVGVGTLLTLAGSFVAGGVLLLPGTRGNGVRILQAELNALGDGPMAENGIYGPDTVAAVRRFQRQEGLWSDGMAGPLTRAAIARQISLRLRAGVVLPRMSPIGLGDAGGAVLRFREEMQLAGLLTAGKAMTALENRVHMAVTNVADSHTVRSLGSTLATPVAEAASTPSPTKPAPVALPVRSAPVPTPPPPAPPVSTPVPAPAQPPAPVPATGSFEVLGFMTAYGSGLSAQDALAHIGALSALSPLWYGMAGDGSIQGGGNSGITSRFVSQGREVLPMVTNSGYNMLLGAAVRNAAARNLLTLAEQGGYQGINLDFELLPSWTRGDFTAFVQEVATVFHAHGLVVSVDVGPKFTSDPSANPAAVAYDYAALGAAADRIILMTYDLHGPSTTPGAISTPSWDQEVVRYALARIPARKILLGIAAYGYDWQAGSANPVSDGQAQALAAATGANIQWSSSDQEPYFAYVQDGVSHQVWWDNSEALSARLALVRQDGIGGIAVWRLGDEGSRFWQVLG